MRGIHSYNSYDDMIKDITDKFISRNSQGKIYVADFIPAEHTIGEPLETLVNICMNTAKP